MFDPRLGVLEVPEYFTAHGLEWFADMPLYDVNGYGKRRKWYFKTNIEGTILHEGCNQSYKHLFFFYFLQVFPIKHLPLIIALTNKKLQEDKGQETHDVTQGELL